MNPLKIILSFLALLLLALVVYLLLVPSFYQVERNLEIQAPKELVFAKIEDFQQWPQWDIRLESDSSFRFEPSEITRYPEGSYRWRSRESTGLEVFTARLGVDSLLTERQFQNGRMLQSTWILNSSAPDRTTIRWVIREDLGFLARWKRSQRKAAQAQEMEGSLAQLKVLVESERSENMSLRVQRGEMPARAYYGLEISGAVESLGPDLLAQQFERIGSYLGILPNELEEGPFIIYHQWNEGGGGGGARLECGLLSEAELPGTAEIIKSLRYGGPIAFIDMPGPYENTGKAHLLLRRYLEDQGLSLAAPPLEIYLKTPGEAEKSYQWLTRIAYPVARQDSL